MSDLPTWSNFVIAAAGGTSGWMFVHPFDVLKVRLQINEGVKISPIRAMGQIFAQEGLPGLYSGLSGKNAVSTIFLFFPLKVELR